MSDTLIKLRKKEYNQSTDNGDGIIVFDTVTNTIIVGGDSFSSSVKDVYWDNTSKLLTITEVDGTTHELNLIDDTSANAPNSILASIRDDVNVTKTSISVLNGTGVDSVTGKITSKLNSLDTTVNIATVSNDIITLKQQLNETGGQIDNSSSASVTLSKVAKTGVATDINADYTEINSETGERTQVVKPVQTILDDMSAQIVTLSSKKFTYVVPTSNGTTPRGFRHYYGNNQSRTGSLDASDVTISNIYLCKTESYTGPYHQIVTIANGSTYSWLDVTSDGISLNGYVKTISINGKNYVVNSGTDTVTVGDVINLINGEQDISVAYNSDFVRVLTEKTVENGVATINLSSKVKVVDIDRTSETVDGLASAKNVKDYVRDNNTTFRTWTEDDIEDL